MTRRPARPPRSARRLPWREAGFAALDFETTGLDPARDDVISFGVVPISDGRIDLSGVLYREVSPRVEPRHSSIRIHHLRAQDLATAPPMSAVVDGFRDALAGRVILAWAAGVEISFLRRIFGGGERRWRGRTIDVRTLVPGVPLLARSGRALQVRTRVHNLSTRPFPAQATYGRRLVRLGAQLCGSDGALLNRDFARAWLPRALQPGASADVAIEIPAPATPGRYTLKFDLVSEGIDWFERCGSETTSRTLVVF